MILNEIYRDFEKKNSNFPNLARLILYIDTEIRLNIHAFEYVESSTQALSYFKYLKMFHHFRQVFNEITTHEMPRHSIPSISLIPYISTYGHNSRFLDSGRKIPQFFRPGEHGFPRDFRARNFRKRQVYRAANQFTPLAAAICILKLSTGDPNCKFRYNNAAFVNIFSIGT